MDERGFGRSAWSRQSLGVTLPELADPDPPSLKAESISDGASYELKAVARWQRPAMNSAAEFVCYELQMKTRSEAGAWTSWTHLTARAEDIGQSLLTHECFEISTKGAGFAPGTTCKVRIKAVAEPDCSTEWVESNELQIPGAIPMFERAPFVSASSLRFQLPVTMVLAVIQKPNAPKAVLSGRATVALEWAPGSTWDTFPQGACQVTSFDVDVFEVHQGVKGLPRAVIRGSGDTSAELGDLIAGMEYTFCVRGYADEWTHQVVYSEWSDGSAVITIPCACTTNLPILPAPTFAHLKRLSV